MRFCLEFTYKFNVKHCECLRQQAGTKPPVFSDIIKVSVHTPRPSAFVSVVGSMASIYRPAVRRMKDLSGRHAVSRHRSHRAG